MPAKFEVYPDKSGAYRWRLKAANGVTVASSGESFSSKAAAISGCEATKRASAEAEIEETEG
jgi:uncharacterized protein